MANIYIEQNEICMVSFSPFSAIDEEIPQNKSKARIFHLGGMSYTISKSIPTFPKRHLIRRSKSDHRTSDRIVTEFTLLSIRKSSRKQFFRFSFYLRCMRLSTANSLHFLGRTVNAPAGAANAADPPVPGPGPSLGRGAGTALAAETCAFFRFLALRSNGSCHQRAVLEHLTQ